MKVAPMNQNVNIKISEHGMQSGTVAEIDKNNQSATTMQPQQINNNATSDDITTVEEHNLRFDRRWEPRARTTGWAQVICSSPYHMFLGGTKKLADFSQHGIGLISDCTMPEGELVEVRLLPFRVRGKLGIVTRCEKITTSNPDTPAQTNKPQYHIGISFQKARSAA